MTHPTMTGSPSCSSSIGAMVHSYSRGPMLIFVFALVVLPRRTCCAAVTFAPQGLLGFKRLKARRWPSTISGLKPRSARSSRSPPVSTCTSVASMTKYACRGVAARTCRNRRLSNCTARLAARALPAAELGSALAAPAPHGGGYPAERHRVIGGDLARHVAEDDAREAAIALDDPDAGPRPGEHQSSGRRAARSSSTKA